jgi:Cu+-exporting ATPase
VFGLLFALTMRRGAKDPVCGMTVDRETPYTSSYHGRTVYFCSAHCKARFDADPESFLGAAGREAAPMAHAGEHVHH